MIFLRIYGENTMENVNKITAMASRKWVLLEAEQELNLTGYNLKTGIRGTISADIAEPGSIVLSARLFGDIIRRLPDDMVTLSTDDLMVNIT